jgi:uncharacterized protein YbjT (DUF2867 family)
MDLSTKTKLRILLTGVTGYIGKRLLPVLLEEGHTVYCCVRDSKRANLSLKDHGNLHVLELDFLKEETLKIIPTEINVAYYLIHSMNASTTSFSELEKQCALNFKKAIQNTQAKQVIYLSGIINENDLSEHLQSRKIVEETLSSEKYALTTLRAGIIVGSGSASFEIIRDLVEKLPAMVTPKWLNTKSQPIAIRNVIQFLKGILLREDCYNKSYDIGGPEILTYKEMLLRFAHERKLKRLIFTVPVMTPRLSSYWLYFVTSTSYKLAVNLVDSMKIEIVCSENSLATDLGIELLSYTEAVQLAFDKIEQQEVVSSWTDSLSSRVVSNTFTNLLKVPSFGCLRDMRKREIKNTDVTINKIWAIGGETGWYYANFLWEFRGFIDKVVGGVGIRRGRKNKFAIEAGESLDFWRVIYASKKEGRLLLYAEMKLPGEAWLEFNVQNNELIQTATFRPRGLWGRLYWFSLLPFHHIIFGGMIRKIAS